MKPNFLLSAGISLKVCVLYIYALTILFAIGKVSTFNRYVLKCEGTDWRCEITKERKRTHYVCMYRCADWVFRGCYFDCMQFFTIS